VIKKRFFVRIKKCVFFDQDRAIMDKCDECKQPVSADFNYHKLRCSRWGQYAERFPMAWKYADNCGDWPPEDNEEKANQCTTLSKTIRPPEDKDEKANQCTTSSKTITKCEECGQSVSADFNYHEKQCSRWASYQQFFVKSAGHYPKSRLDFNHVIIDWLLTMKCRALQ
jgi:hypothetical protein